MGGRAVSRNCVDVWRDAVWFSDVFCTCGGASKHDKQCPRLSTTERIVALAMARWATWGDGYDVRPGADRIAQITGLTTYSIHRTRAALEEKGWIELLVKGGARRGEHRLATEHRLTLPAVWFPTGDIESLVIPGSRTGDFVFQTGDFELADRLQRVTPPPHSPSDDPLISQPPGANTGHRKSPVNVCDQCDGSGIEAESTDACIYCDGTGKLLHAS